MYENETFHKSVYTCCFEILLNSSFVSKSFTGTSAKQQTEKVNFLTLIELKSDQFRFPYSLKNLKLDPVDLLRIIELFITNTSINNQTNSIHLNKSMIRHLNTMEEYILELLCWSKESKLWTLVKQLKLVCPGPNVQSDLTQLNFPFPLYDEVGFVNSPQLSHGTGPSGSFLTAAVLTNPKGESSPAKPTITRVVCSTNSSTTTTVSNDNMILTTKTLPNNSSKQIQVLTLTPTGSRIKNQKHGRLLNMTSFLTYFFRKFYNLANVRLRYLLDKLNVNSLLSEPDQANSSQPLTPASASTPILTPVTSSTLKPSQSVNSEKHQLLLKKIWNIFEFSLSLGADKNSSLIRGRHLDQMLLCAVYLACKLTRLPILFTEIVRVYKCLRSDSSSIYRDVLLDQAEHGGDLIQFYNTIYIKCMKEFALRVHAKSNSQMASNPDNKLAATPVNNLHLLSPVPRPAQINLNINLQFTSRKIVDTKSVLISPSRDRLVSSTAQFVQPINNKYSGRNKLVYLFDELGSEKMIFQINEMIRKSEVKIRGSNKRLFSEMSSHCLPISALGAKTSSNSEDERDGRVKLTKIGPFGAGQSGLSHANTMLGHSGPTSSNFLSKIVSSKLGSRSNSNLVTMVVGSSPNQNQSMNLSLPLGANFSRRIQTIQNERTNVN
ncbi:Retinoblastoma 1 [Brachionus plicatilis]|uniref:Retinoblastoma 1 n=1 Tax=Brachionus plicatilis TaxID=10195 RepID=A0A3M7QKH1_BRAPC|nr:Retinoblastoma 1 [Brachionus plicatilis]